MDFENKYGTLKTQQYYLSLIEDFHLYCNQHNIDYSLAYGTLLGAIRHKAFIPWDDDIDIMMTRDNYDKFIECFKNRPMVGYTLVGKLWIKKLSKKNNPFIDREIQCIDLFVLDRLPKNKFLASFKIFTLKFVQGMLKENIDYRRYSFMYRILLFITHVIGSFLCQDNKKVLYDKISRCSGLLGSGECISISNAEFKYMNQFFPISIVTDYISLDFEGKKLMGIVGYDKYLTRIYGDYMTPPKESERLPKHLSSR